MRYESDMEQFELKISQCESTEEFAELVSSNPDMFGLDWQSYITPLLDARGLTPSQIACGCGVVLPTARSFYNKIPTKRVNVIMLAMLMGLSVEQANDMLVRHAHYQKLYSKNPDDAIWIYLLERGGSPEPKELFASYKAQYERMKEAYIAPIREKLAMDTGIAYDHIKRVAKGGSVNTIYDREFTQMMRDLMPAFERSYQKLLAYIELHFPYLEREDALDQGLVELEEELRRKKRRRFGWGRGEKQRGYMDKRSSPNEMFDLKYTKKYYRAYKQIEDDHSVPSRTFLVSLGVRLNMSIQQINKMLDLAGMGPLCAGDRLEAAIIYYLEELDCQIPTYFYRPRELRDGMAYDQLQVFSLRDELERLRRLGLEANRQNSFWSQLDEICELPPEHLNDYLKRKLEETDIFEKSDQKALDKLLDLL